MITGQLKPSVIDCQRFRDKDENFKQRQKRNFDSHHGVQELAILNAGSPVWIPNLQTKGTVQKDVLIRSYTVNTERRADVRRNRRHLNHLPEENKSNEEQIIQEQQPEQAKSPSDAEKSGSATKTTRSGREVKTPNRYVEQC